MPERKLLKEHISILGCPNADESKKQIGHHRHLVEAKSIQEKSGEKPELTSMQTKRHGWGSITFMFGWKCFISM